MATWKKRESMAKAAAREGRRAAKGALDELLSIATLRFY
jgi:hypothetical protein